jgi:hypothetical protein
MLKRCKKFIFCIVQYILLKGLKKYFAAIKKVEKVVNILYIYVVVWMRF